MVRKSVRSLLALVWLIVFLTVATPATSAKTLTITGILGWFGGPSLIAGAEAFLAKHPDVELNIIGGSPDQVIVGIVGGAPADIVGLATGEIPSWAAQGLLEPVTAYVERSGVNPSEFIPPAWQSVVYQGDVWGLPVIVDPNFGLIYNKRLFREAGLDPERPPATIEDLDSMFAPLTRRSPDGGLQQIGVTPWSMIGGSFTTWGWAFGGRFVDYETGAVTAHHPANVEALNWLKGYYNQYNSDYLALAQSMDTGQEGLFAGERLAMFLGHSGAASQVMAAAPDLDIGIAITPHKPEAGTPTWLGGWGLAIPKGAADPELAWEFIRTVAATAEGTDAFAREAGWFTAFIPSPSWGAFMEDPLLGPFVNIALGAQHTPPAVPAAAKYSEHLNMDTEGSTLFDFFENRIFSAQEALEKVTRLVEEANAEILGRR